MNTKTRTRPTRAKTEAEAVRAAKAQAPRPVGRNWNEPKQEPSSKSFTDRIHAHASHDWSDNSVEDRLSIDADVVENLKREGIVLQWCTESVLGMNMPEHFAKFERGGWMPVQPGDIDGVPVTEVGGLQLMARSAQIDKKAKSHEAQLARDQVRTKEQSLYGGDLKGVTLDSRHESATRSNRINRSYEPLAIPQD